MDIHSSALNCITRSFSRLQLFNMDIAEHHQAGLVVQLQSDGPRLRPSRLACVLRNKMAVELDADHFLARFDIEGVPVVFDLMTRFGGVEQIDAPRRKLAPVAVADLDLVAD